MSSTNDLTQIRATKQAVKRIDRMASKLEASRGGRWSRPAVIEAAIDALEAADAAKAQAAESPTA